MLSKQFLWDVNLNQGWTFSCCLFHYIQLVSLGLFLFRSLCVALPLSLGNLGKAAILKQHGTDQIPTHLLTLLAQAGKKCLPNSISSMVWIQTQLFSACWIPNAQPHPNTSQLIRDKQAELSGTAHTLGRWAVLQPCSQPGIRTPAELAFLFF